ncbi:ACT domain-containing protein, partial [Patescibacteria group bacterium]
VGIHTTAAKVNNTIVPLDHGLQNGDVVEIVSNTKTQPQREWLESVKTNLARREIRKYFQMRSGKNSEAEGLGIMNDALGKLFSTTFDRLKEKRINTALKKLDISNTSILLRLLGKGDVEVEKIIETLYEPSEIFRSRQDFISKTQNRLGTLLRKPRVHDLDKMENQLAELRIQTTKHTGLLNTITAALAKNEINIYSVSGTQHDQDDAANIFVTIEVRDVKDLLSIINKLKRLPNILDVRRYIKS